MKTSAITPHDLAMSVFAVPPLARSNDLTLNRAENRKLIAHIEAGGVTSILYGGNACMFDVPLSEYGTVLEFLAGATAPETWLLPSAGPDFGRLVDQAPVARDLGFPTVMALPDSSPCTAAGVMTGLRKFADRFGRPIIVYVKTERYLEPPQVAKLFDDGVLCCVKYAVARAQAEQDDYLRALLDVVDRRYVVSGLGERPAIVHVREFGLVGFTSGLACVAPRTANRLLRAIQADDRQAAEALRETFMLMEDHRDRLGAIRVLHDAVTLSGVADMGPILPMLHNLEREHHGEVRRAMRVLLDYEQTPVG